MNRPKTTAATTRRGREIIALEIAALREVAARMDDSFEEAVALLQESIERGGKIIATGIGKSGHIAEKIAATLTSTGAPCVYLNCVNAMHGDLGLVREGDALLMLSYSGETEEMVRMLPALTRESVSLIAVTGNPRSTLAQHAQVHLNVRVRREACPLNLAPTSSTTAMLAMGDALAMVLLEARGVRREDFARFHPGGSIGKTLLLRATDVMRPQDRLARLSGSATVTEALGAMSRARAGAAVIVDRAGKLQGIFTHGDFARLYQKSSAVGGQSLREVMTRRPITVRDTALAVEALRIFEKHQIDDLLVVDHKGHPVGLIDAQDLARHKLV
jgi:arabinose-5-phosphate isomerase